MDRDKPIFYFSTGLITLIMLFSASMYIFQHEMVKGLFTNFGFPHFIIYPLAAAKLLGLVAIWTNKSQTLKEWAYAGFFFDFVLAFFAHRNAADPDPGYLPLIAIVLILISYTFEKRIRR